MNTRWPTAVMCDVLVGMAQARTLHPSLVPFGRDIHRVGIPEGLTEAGYTLDGLICRIASTLAAGVRVGCRQVLTNRHVFDQLAGRRVGTAFTGKQVFAGQPGLTGRAAPPPLPGGTLVMPWYFGRYGDWALLDETPGSTRANFPLRSAQTLVQGQVLWIVGGSDGQCDRVTVGQLRAVKGVNGMLIECDVRPGMSGAAVVDAGLRLVGIFSTQFGWPGRRAMFVTIDAIASGIDILRMLDPGLPQLQVETINAPQQAGA